MLFNSYTAYSYVHIFLLFAGRTKKEKGCRETQEEKLRNRIIKKGNTFKMRFPAYMLFTEGVSLRALKYDEYYFFRYCFCQNKNDENVSYSVYVTCAFLTSCTCKQTTLSKQVHLILNLSQELMSADRELNETAVKLQLLESSRVSEQPPCL